MLRGQWGPPSILWLLTPPVSQVFGGLGVSSHCKRGFGSSTVLVTHGLGAFPTLSEAVATFLPDP